MPSSTMMIYFAFVQISTINSLFPIIPVQSAVILSIPFLSYCAEINYLSQKIIRAYTSYYLYCIYCNIIVEPQGITIFYKCFFFIRHFIEATSSFSCIMSLRMKHAQFTGNFISRLTSSTACFSIIYSLTSFTVRITVQRRGCTLKELKVP